MKILDLNKIDFSGKEICPQDDRITPFGVVHDNVHLNIRERRTPKRGKMHALKVKTFNNLILGWNDVERVGSHLSTNKPEVLEGDFFDC